MRTIHASNQSKTAPAEPAVSKSHTLPSGRAMLQSGVLGAQLIRLAELGAQSDADAWVFAEPAGEPTR